jgi:hypothetical protein
VISEIEVPGNNTANAFVDLAITFNNGERVINRTQINRGFEQPYRPRLKRWRSLKPGSGTSALLPQIWAEMPGNTSRLSKLGSATLTPSRFCY